MSPHESSSGSLLVLLKHLLVLTISVVFLPVSVLALFYNYAALVLCPQNGLRRHVQKSVRFKPRKVIITGVSTPAGLHAARALFATGHNIVGIAEGGYIILNPARWSHAVSKLYSISPPRGSVSDEVYAKNLFRLIVKERANLWLDCSNGDYAEAQAQAKRMIEERTTCICLVPNADQVRKFDTRRGFQQLAQQLGLPSPETYTVRSRNDIFSILNDGNGKKYLLSSPNGVSGPPKRTVLPSRTVSQTYYDVAQLSLSKSMPWTLEQYVDGLPRFTACAVVVEGKLKAFIASSLTQKGVITAVSAKSGLSDAMKQYMESFADAIGPDLSSHLTMEFCLDEKATHAGVVQQILPLGGHLTPHESLLLFDGKSGAMDLTKAYLSLLAPKITELELYTGLPYTDPASSETISLNNPEIGVYFIYRDLQELVAEPIVQLLTMRSGIQTVFKSWVTFLQHLVAWHEALYEFGDPLPLFWYTHVYAPCQIIFDLAHETWSRLDSMRRAGGRKKHFGGVQNGR